MNAGSRHDPRDIGADPTRARKIRVLSAFARVYVLGFFITLMVLEIRLFAAEGLLAWFTLAFIIPLFQALVWPLTVVGYLVA